MNNVHLKEQQDLKRQKGNDLICAHGDQIIAYAHDGVITILLTECINVLYSV